MSSSVAPDQASTTATSLSGEVVYLYAYDVAHEMRREPVLQLLGQPVAQYELDSTRRNPRQLFFFRPQMVRLPILERLGPHGPVRIERSVKLLPVGAISITVRVPFQVAGVDDLLAYHDLRFGSISLHDEVRALAEQVRRELHPFYIHPVPHLQEEEAYTVFCLAGSPAVFAGHASSDAWLGANRRAVSALLNQEPDSTRLSDLEVDECVSNRLSYYNHDLVVVDWDAALVIDDPGHFAEMVYIMELANLQLTELEAYDRVLDEAVESSYRDVGGEPLLGRGSNSRELRELRIDLARLSDELSNITKFFGDWHAARVYQSIAARFHLADWHRSIDEKLKTLDQMYQLLKHDQSNRWMLILEATIVLLFIIDLLLLGAELMKK